MKGCHRPDTVGRERVNSVCPHPWWARRQLPLVWLRCGWCWTKLDGDTHVDTDAMLAILDALDADAAAGGAG